MDPSSPQEQILRIYTFGRPRFSVQFADDEQEVSGFLTTKAEALLIYLCCTGRSHSREALAGLLWSDMPEEKAQRNLRNVLSNLRKLVGSFLSFEQHRVELTDSVWVDSAEFSTAAQSDQLVAASNLYTNDFLRGFTVRNAGLFSEWVDAEQERLRSDMSRVLLELARQQRTAQALRDAQATLNRLVKREPWNEAAHRLLIQVLAESGQRAAALVQFEACRRALRDELGVEPSAETVALIESLSAEHKPIPHNLPPITRTFVGRKDELTLIQERLNREDARLISIVGVGGIGKTGLALTAARSAIFPAPGDVRFIDGVYFVALAEINRDVHDPHLAIAIFNAIANAIGFTFQAESRFADQLADYFSDKQMLLVLDNLEHLLDQAFLLPRLLRAAPNVQVIVTSRERLNLVEEWVLPLEGLMLPETVSAETMLKNDAAALFVQHAERTVGNFTIADNAQDIADICAAVGGLPLGIEMAASWLRIIPAKQIVSEMQHSLDFLSSGMRNRPDRHRSLRAVFDSTWQMLDSTEQAMLERISIFRGTFTREAAQAVALAPLPVLIGLSDKSLVSRFDETQYVLVEYIRQYAEERRAQTPEHDHDIHNSHLRYFSEWLARHTEALEGPKPQPSIHAIEREQENIVSAWHWAVQTGNAAAIELMHVPLSRYWRSKGTLVNATGFMEVALAQFSAEANPDLHVNLQLEYAFILRAQGASKPATAALRVIEALLADKPPSFTKAATFLHLGRYLRDSGDIEQGKRYLDMARDCIDPASMQLLHGQLLMQFGMTERVESINARIRADYAAEQAAHEREKAYFLQAIEVLEAGQHSVQLALAYEWLGTSLRELDDLAQAEVYYLQAVNILNRIGTNHGLPGIYLNLAEVALDKEDDDAALAHFRQGFRIAQVEKRIMSLFYVVYMASNLYQMRSQPDSAIVCLVFLLRRKRLVEVMRTESKTQLDALRTQLSAERYTAAQRRGELATLETMLAMIATDFDILETD